MVSRCGTRQRMCFSYALPISPSPTAMLGKGLVVVGCKRCFVLCLWEVCSGSLVVCIQGTLSTVHILIFV